MNVRVSYKESWTPKNWCFGNVVLDKTFESPLDSKEIQPVHPKGNQSWIHIGRTHAEAETPILWPPDAKNWLIRKDPDAGKDWRGEGKETTEDDITDPMDMSMSKLQWWTGKPDVLQSMGLQRVGHNWATELNWISWSSILHIKFYILKIISSLRNYPKRKSLLLTEILSAEV